jgi:hypothetical protein
MLLGLVLVSAACGSGKSSASVFKDEFRQIATVTKPTFAPVIDAGAMFDEKPLPSVDAGKRWRVYPDGKWQSKP